MTENGSLVTCAPKTPPHRFTEPLIKSVKELKADFGIDVLFLSNQFTAVYGIESFLGFFKKYLDIY